MSTPSSADASVSSALPSTASPTPAFAVLSICGVLAVSALDLFVPPLGVPLALLMIFLLLRWRKEPWSALGLRRPRRWWPLWAMALLAAMALQATSVFVVLPLLQHFGIPMPDFSVVAALEGNHVMLAVYLVVSWTTAGFGEEVIWRGFLMTRIMAIFGCGPLGWGLALVLSSVGFGLMHAYQGTTGIFLTGFVGLILGLVYLVSGRQLWLVILIHALTDTIAMLIFYSGAWRGLMPGT